MSLVVAFGILRSTPWWVFVLFALLLWLGVRSLRPRVTSVSRVFITPGVFITWGLVAFAAGARSSPTALASWLFTALVGFALAAVTVRLPELRVDRAHRLVRIPASAVPLVRNLSVFAVKYGLAVGMAMHPEARGPLALWDTAVSGASAGYFVGWAACFALAYRRSPGSDLIASPAGDRLEHVEAR